MMNMRIFSGCFRLVVVLAALLVSGAVLAQTYPSRPITIVVPSSPGGVTDPITRVIGDGMQRAWGQTVIMEHRTGAGGVVGSQHVARSQPDGYVLMLGNFGPLAVAPSLMRDIPYDVQKDFAPVALAITFQNVLVVPPDLAAKTTRELIQLAKSSPGKLSFASAGIGQSQHLSGELFRSMAGIDIVHIPYKGTGPATTDLLGGRVDMMFGNVPAALPHIKAGKLRALAVTGATRSKAMPEVPTINESGVPGYNVTSWLALVAPARTPKDIIDRLNAEAIKALNAPEGLKVLEPLEAEPGSGSPEDLGRFMRAEQAKWGKLIREANIKAE